MSAMTEIRDRLQASGDEEAATALDVAMRAASDRLDEITELSQSLAHKDARITDFMDICEDLSRKLEEARGRIGELETKKP